MLTTAWALSFLMKIMNAILKFNVLAAGVVNVPYKGVVAMKQSLTSECEYSYYKRRNGQFNTLILSGRATVQTLTDYGLPHF